MDLKQIKQIIDLMKRSELTEFAIEEEGFKLKIRRGANELPLVSTNSPSPSGYALSAPTPPPASALAQGASLAPSSAPVQDDAGIGYIKSPMVGTFYRAPSPDSKPFADVGLKFTETTPVCIIEAMKIMNEIQAEIKGTIVEVLAENGQPVEYGQRLFKVKIA